MKVRFLFSSPEGDIPADEPLLARRFLVNPLEEHPSLKLKDYFRAIEHFLFVRQKEALSDLLSRKWQRPVHAGDLDEALIRSEKHGTLYHLASVEILASGSRARFTLSTAVSEINRQWLAREFETIRFLQESLHLPCLPEAYFLDALEWETARGPAALSLMMGEWFEDYHEWHLNRSESGEADLIIWDHRRGYRKAGSRESREIYFQASRILTLYYNMSTSLHIHPWHHAAGDFVVKSAGEVVDVRLTTARGYEPLVIFSEDQDINPVMALLYFFLDLSFRMRLDRWGGVGEMAWAGDSCVKPSVEGFLQALREMETEGRYGPGSVDDFRSLLRTFGEQDFLRLYRTFFEAYRRESAEMVKVAEREIEGHCRSLYGVIQTLPG
ncbi:MAG: hypothetical protein JXL84_01420 [Deltaproteobacteria bacterium]|nr:hypothetical protein [Deltaproteobacteria bacterium]